MINIIWMILLVGGIIIGIFTGNTQAVTDALMSNAETAVELSMGLIGMMALWLGIMKIAEEAGLVTLIGKALKPLIFSFKNLAVPVIVPPVPTPATKQSTLPKSLKISTPVVK